MNVLLLDFDGVIFNNARTNELIQSQVTAFYSKKLNIPLQLGRHSNIKGFKKYGHTVRLLNSLHKNTSISEFNTFVYNNDVLSQVHSAINNNDVETFKRWVDSRHIAHSMGYSIKIFSNAPFKWIDHCISELESLSDCTFDVDDCITSDLNYLKPDLEWYNNVEGSASNVVFVDDNETNLIKKNWTNVLYSNNSSTASTASTAKEPEDVVRILETL